MNVLTVNLYKAGVTTKFVKYEDLDDNDKLLDCVHPLPLADNTLRLSFSCTGCGHKWSDIYKVHRVTEQVIHPRKDNQ